MSYIVTKLEQWEQDFNLWYKSHEWFHDPYEELSGIWLKLHNKGFEEYDIREIMDDFIQCMKGEYGE